jgi:hypothetical protein
MSWVDQANHGIFIRTGDGKEYSPLWKEPQKVKEFNITQFDFPNIAGSFVSRGTPKGRKIPLELYFVGEDHLDQADAFDTSSDDPRSWFIIHPYYGSFQAQPTTINFDNTGGNVSKITVSLIETIVDDSPISASIVPTDKIVSDIAVFDETVSESFVTSIPKPDAQNINGMRNNATNIYNEGVKSLREAINADEYFNLFNEAQTAILNATDIPLEAINTTLALINYPFQFVDSVKNRIDLILRQFGILRSTVTNLVRPSDKVIYEKSASFMLATAAQASITEVDYQSAPDVLVVMEQIMDAYNEYVEDIDSIQTENGTDENSYIADHDTMIQIQSIINYTVSNLLQIALNSKKERTMVLEYDSNSIVLAHRFYPLNPTDSTIDYFIATNGFGLVNNLQIKKGTVIKYYR